MKRMVSILLLTAILLLSIMGCTSRETAFLGKWDCETANKDMGWYFIFEKKGVLKMLDYFEEEQGYPAEVFGTYKIVDDDIMVIDDIAHDKTEWTYKFTKNGTRLTMSLTDPPYSYLVHVFTKVETEDVSQ